MKLMFYINTICHGGAERVLVNLATQFAEDDEERNECILVTSFKRDHEYELNKNIKRKTLQINEEMNFFKRNYLLITELRKVIKKEKPDLVISFMAEPNIRLMIAKWNLKTKTLISIRNDPAQEYNNLIFRICAKVLFRVTDGVVFQTDDAKKWFSNKIQNNSELIMNQVAEEFFVVKKRENINEIVSVGRLSEQKNHELLIRAFADIADKVEAKLVIYGEGVLRDYLQDIIKELKMENRIFLPGIIENVPERIVNSRLFVLPSNFEGMPNCLLEAMALGIPSISTDCPCGGPREIIKNGENGFLVEIGNQQQLSMTMLKVLQEKSIADQIGNNAQISANEFRPAIIYSKWRTYVKSIVNR